MKESEIIIVDYIPSQVYYSLIKESAKYAIISIPFTINRMHLENLEKRIENIAKGKLAENLFAYYCSENGIAADFNTPSTPFYQTDHRDFLLDGYEWDIKNNFIHHDGNVLQNINYTDLPALVPDRHAKDQWSKRNQKIYESTKGVRFLFTFLKSTDKNSREQFLSIRLSQQQIDFLQQLANKYGGNTFKEKPFKEKWFWSKMSALKDEKLSLIIRDFPNLVIAGYADAERWNFFKPTNSLNDNNFQNYQKPFWYEKIRKGETQLLKFMDGVIWTRIKNATLPVSMLKAFNF